MPETLRLALNRAYRTRLPDSPLRTLPAGRSTDAMDAGLHRIEDDLADDALDTWIETVLAELEAYLAYVTGSES